MYGHYCEVKSTVVGVADQIRWTGDDVIFFPLGVLTIVQEHLWMVEAFIQHTGTVK